MATTLTNTVKTDLGITNTKKDTEIAMAIDSAKTQMAMRGVTVIQETDPTTVNCILLFCRQWFNFQGEADRFFQAFEFLANAMAKSTEYGEDAVPPDPEPEPDLEPEPAPDPDDGGGDDP